MHIVTCVEVVVVTLDCTKNPSVSCEPSHRAAWGLLVVCHRVLRDGGVLAAAQYQDGL